MSMRSCTLVGEDVRRPAETKCGVRVATLGGIASVLCFRQREVYYWLRVAF